MYETEYTIDVTVKENTNDSVAPNVMENIVVPMVMENTTLKGIISQTV